MSAGSEREAPKSAAGLLAKVVGGVFAFLVVMALLVPPEEEALAPEDVSEGEPSEGLEAGASEAGASSFEVSLYAMQLQGLASDVVASDHRITVLLDDVLAGEVTFPQAASVVREERNNMQAILLELESMEPPEEMATAHTHFTESIVAHLQAYDRLEVCLAEVEPAACDEATFHMERAAMEIELATDAIPVSA